MNALQGAVKNGQMVLDEPAELPEGSRVEAPPGEAAVRSTQAAFPAEEETGP